MNRGRVGFSMAESRIGMITDDGEYTTVTVLIPDGLIQMTNKSNIINQIIRQSKISNKMYFRWVYDNLIYYEWNWLKLWENQVFQISCELDGKVEGFWDFNGYISPYERM